MKRLLLTVFGTYLALIVFSLAFLGFLRLEWPDRMVSHAAQYNGGAYCNQTIAITVASGSSTAVFTAVPGLTEYVCGYDISGDTAVTGLQWKTGTTNLSGVEVVAVDGHFTAGGGEGILIQGATGQNITINATTGGLAGWVRAGQF